MRRMVLLAMVAACGGAGTPATTVPAAPAVEVAALPAPAPTTTAVITVPSAPATTTTTAAAATTISTTSCNDPVPFRYPPVDLDGVEYIVPLGQMYDSHVTPVDHIYLENFADPQRVIDVYSPAGGRVTSIQHMNQAIAEDPTRPVDDYRLVIDHRCTLSSIFIHIGSLAERIAAVAPPPGEYASVDVEVAAGERIGSFQANVDYSLVDMGFTTDRLLVPEHYTVEPWKIHTPDPFPYFTEPIRRRMENLSLRNGEPAAGVFTYDIDGRLVGNWFLQGSGGYGGLGPPRYWSTHLSVAYNHIDPRLVMVSLGDFDGASRQFAVAGNGPDPAQVTVETGPAVYELVDFDYWVDGERWDRVSYAAGIEADGYDQVAGVVLFQLVDGRTLRVEVFPGVTAATVGGFTDAALIYER